MNYAFIENDVVTNVIWLSPSNASEFSNAVPIGDILVDIGDTYDGQNFYRDGEKVLSPVILVGLELEDAKNALKVLGVIEDE